MWTTPMYNTTKLTLELRDLVENGVKIWDFDYPSYYKDEQKKAFEQKVIDHYYFRQIGQETTGRFLHMFRSRIREIMPYYIELYKTAEIMANIDDPFGNIDVTETSTETRKGTVSTTGSATETNSGASETTSNSESNTTSEVNLNGKTVSSGTDSYSDYTDKDHKSSDTPQGSVVNITQYMTNYETGYDSVQHDGTKSETNTQTDKTTTTGTVADTSSNSSTNSNTVTSSGDSATSNDETITHTTTKKGNQGVNTYAHDMIEFRQSIINVDMMVITALNDLFLGVY